MLTSFLFIAATASAELPGWAVRRVEDARVSAPVLLAVGGPEANTLAAEAQAALDQQVVVLRGIDALADWEALLARESPACGILLLRGEEGTLSLRQRGDCSVRRITLEGVPGAPSHQLSLRPTTILSQQPLTLDLDGVRTSVSQGEYRLSLGELALLGRDQDTLAAYLSESRRVQRAGALSLGVAGTLAIAAKLALASCFTRYPVPGGPYTWITIEGLATTTALVTFPAHVARKHRLNRLSSWYSEEELRRLTATYNDSLSASSAPPTPEVR